jgi:hypothetical protein
VAGGFIDKRLAIEPYGGPALLRCWYRLREYIEQERPIRGYFCDNYEGFTRLCLDYFHNLGVEVKYHKPGQKPKELVFQELQDKELKPRTFEEIQRSRDQRKQELIKSSPTKQLETE